MQTADTIFQRGFLPIFAPICMNNLRAMRFAFFLIGATKQFQIILIQMLERTRTLARSVSHLLICIYV